MNFGFSFPIVGGLRGFVGWRGRRLGLIPSLIVLALIAYFVWY